MRAFSHAAPEEARPVPSLTHAEWDALPLHACVAERTADILVLLDRIRDELHTEEGSPLLWLEEPLQWIADEADRVLRRVSM